MGLLVGGIGVCRVFRAFEGCGLRAPSVGVRISGPTASYGWIPSEDKKGREQSATTEK